MAIILGLSVVFGGCIIQSSYDWALETIEKNYVGGEFDPSLAEEKTPAALAALLDKYSAYYTKEEYDEVIKSNAGEFYGIGVSLQQIEGAGALIVSVSGNSPALKAGLKTGDIIIGGEVDGESVTFENYAQFSEFIAARAKGEQFILRTEDGEYTLSKESFTQSYVTMRTKDTGWEFRSSVGDSLALFENKDLSLDFLPEDAAYIKLSQFYGGAVNEFGRVVEKFNAYSMNTLILDLRSNGGGYVNVMQSIGGYFVKSASKVAMTAVYKGGKSEKYYCGNHPQKIGEGVQVYILANSGTASASEALIGVLVDYGICSYENIFISDYIGQSSPGRTYGKGIMQSMYVNSWTKEVLKLTCAKIYWPNGKCIHDIGLTAEDGCTLVQTENTVTKEDKELKDVVEIIKTRQG
ncbi:MAG: PDZ domain-containing protein [Clostridiales bacterium]|nr:PDZ domain-containing protein [Clostridiales bacterium]